MPKLPKQLSKHLYNWVKQLRPHLPFIVVLLGGVVLRILSALAYWPALLYYGDSYYYLQNSQALRPDSFHPLGYAFFIRLFSSFNKLAEVTTIQHLLVVMAAILAYLFLLKLKLKPWLAAVATAPLLLDAYLINTENMIMAETLTTFLLLAGCIALAWPKKPIIWQLVAGLAFAAATLTRPASAVIIIPAVMFAFIYSRPSLKNKLRVTGLLLISFLVPVMLYSWYHHTYDGHFAIDNKTNFFLYGRLAPLADCQRLPAAQQNLCDSRPPAQREGPAWYLWSPHSPLRQSVTSTTYHVPEAPLAAFNHAVIKRQGADYVGSTIVETLRYFKPDRSDDRQNHRQDDLVRELQFPTQSRWTSSTFLANNSLQIDDQTPNSPPAIAGRRLAGWLNAYQKFGYLPGPLLGLAVIGAVVAYVKRRSSAALVAVFFVSSALIILLASSAVAALNYRYLVPVEGLLWLGGILGVSALYQPPRQTKKTTN